MLTIKNIKSIEGLTLIVDNSIWMITKAYTTSEAYQFVIQSTSIQNAFLELGLNRYGFEFGKFGISSLKVYQIQRYHNDPKQLWPTFGMTVGMLSDKRMFIEQLQNWIKQNYKTI